MAKDLGRFTLTGAGNLPTDAAIASRYDLATTLREEQRIERRSAALSVRHGILARVRGHFIQTAPQRVAGEAAVDAGGHASAAEDPRDLARIGPGLQMAPGDTSVG
jgi:hypothetical protein